MHLPQLQPTRPRTIQTTTFLGLNANDAIQDGEMAAMRNLSSRSFPLLDQRPERASITYISPVIGLHGREKLVEIRGNYVYYNGTRVTDLSVNTSAQSLPKKIVSMGAYVTIWPDKIYFNTANLNDCGYMELRLMKDMMDTGLSLCRLDGTSYDFSDIFVSTMPPEDPDTGDLWMDTSGSTDVLKQYGTDGWTEILTTYIKISATGIGEGFSVYETVTISGLSYPGHSGEPIAAEVDALNGDHIIYGTGDDYIIIAGIMRGAISSLSPYQPADFTVERTVPDLDYICESNNRLWGCRYGFENGQVINELRACKLGDFKNWNCFMGLSTDSYAASVGTDGPFTGAATQRGNPIFFKENCIHRVTGSSPSSFSVNVIGCRGIQEGSWRSAVVIDESIFYKALDGVYYFDGSMAYEIGEQLGKKRYSDARAGQLDGKYYISMMDTNSEWSLFVYDSKQRMWHREDELKALGFATSGGELYAADEDTGKLILMTGNDVNEWGAKPEGPFEWSATFGFFGMDFTNKHYLSRFNIRMQMDEEATFHLAIQYDQDGVWHDQGEIRGRTTKTFLLPVIPRRCDHLQVRLRGTGRCRVYSISRILEVGGDG